MAGPGAEGALYLAGSIVVGVVMGRLVEVPVLAARDRMLP